MKRADWTQLKRPRQLRSELRSQPTPRLRKAVRYVVCCVVAVCLCVVWCAPMRAKLPPRSDRSKCLFRKVGWGYCCNVEGPYHLTSGAFEKWCEIVRFLRWFRMCEILVWKKGKKNIVVWILWCIKIQCKFCVATRPNTNFHRFTGIWPVSENSWIWVVCAITINKNMRPVHQISLISPL